MLVLGTEPTPLSHVSSHFLLLEIGSLFVALAGLEPAKWVDQASLELTEILLSHT